MMNFLQGSVLNRNFSLFSSLYRISCPRRELEGGITCNSVFPLFLVLLEILQVKLIYLQGEKSEIRFYLF